MTLTEECKAVDRNHPGWHAWRSDEGKILLTHAMHGPLGCGVTLDCPHIGRAANIIAEYEHALHCAAARERARGEGWGVAA